FELLSLVRCCDLADGSLSSYSGDEFRERKPVIGSRPPACINRCLSCRPCMAVLVVPPHHKESFQLHDDIDANNYYLLSWKCRCGNRVFQP
ncbi:EPIDERMAL PATTERNING FACTOR-like protein 8, partial [Amborella trichopoda]|uniref:EPIDERMAL PATTERNING FACTOR-like protein 8 n=1 Tax=Amborella trichopoda TaxID=13333 RepID=UPI0009BCFF1A